MKKYMSLNLDPDVAKLVRRDLRREGLEWDTLPLSLQVKLLAPHVTTQMAREQSLLAEVCG